MFFRKKIEVPKEIEEFNSFSPEKEKLLCIGAAVTDHVIISGVAKPHFLKLYYTSKGAQGTLKNWLPMFGIYTEYNANNLITSWIAENSYVSVISPYHKNKVQKKIEKTAKKIGVDGSSLIQSAENLSGLGAFDLERLGYLIRVCFTLDLLTEEQAWNYLEQLYLLAKEHYNSWDDYIASYCYGNEAKTTSWYKDIIPDYLKIRQAEQNLFDKYPLGE